jgi:hypothetical protein
MVVERQWRHLIALHILDDELCLLSYHFKHLNSIFSLLFVQLQGRCQYSRLWSERTFTGAYSCSSRLCTPLKNVRVKIAPRSLTGTSLYFLIPHSRTLMALLRSPFADSCSPKKLLLTKAWIIQVLDEMSKRNIKEIGVEILPNNDRDSGTKAFPSPRL